MSHVKECNINSENSINFPFNVALWQ